MGEVLSGGDPAVLVLTLSGPEADVVGLEDDHVGLSQRVLGVLVVYENSAEYQLMQTIKKFLEKFKISSAYLGQQLLKANN